MAPNSGLICGFLKCRNEIIRSGNIYRCLFNLEQVCDEIFAVDDASWDGTREYLISRLGQDRVICVPPEQHNFSEELKWKQELLKKIHQNGPFGFILWQDADEVLDARATSGLRDFCSQRLDNNQNVRAWSFHYTQLWENSSYARTDEGFDDGRFIKLWRYSPDLAFNVVIGTHHPQMPLQVLKAFQEGKVESTPFEVIHYGNYGKNLVFKCIQYWGGLGGVERHMFFDKGSYRKVPDELFPPGVDLHGSAEPPKGWSSEYIARLKDLQNLTNLQEYFCVIIPTYNRAYSLPGALDSLLAQTYPKWFCIVLDDGSSADNTAELMWEYQKKDPRIFYCRYLEQRGGVAMNEIGCEIACRTASWWTRLGSDDAFLPKKLERDAAALRQYAFIYSPFKASRKGILMEMGNLPVASDLMIPVYEKGGFFCGWAGIALRTDLLRQIKQKYGSFNPSGLVNMDDVIQNYRATKLSPPVWRGVYKGQFVVNPSSDLMAQIQQNSDGIEIDAWWNCNEQDGASANMNIYAKDRSLCTRLILAEKDMK